MDCIDSSARLPIHLGFQPAKRHIGPSASVLQLGDLFMHNGVRRMEDTALCGGTSLVGKLVVDGQGPHLKRVSVILNMGLDRTADGVNGTWDIQFFSSLEQVDGMGERSCSWFRGDWVNPSEKRVECLCVLSHWDGLQAGAIAWLG